MNTLAQLYRHSVGHFLNNIIYICFAFFEINNTRQQPLIIQILGIKDIARKWLSPVIQYDVYIKIN